MELQYQVEQLQDVAIVRCSGRLVRGAVLDGFRQRLEQIAQADAIEVAFEFRSLYLRRN